MEPTDTGQIFTATISTLMTYCAAINIDFGKYCYLERRLFQ